MKIYKTYMNQKGEKRKVMEFYPVQPNEDVFKCVSAEEDYDEEDDKFWGQQPIETTEVQMPISFFKDFIVRFPFIEMFIDFISLYEENPGCKDNYVILVREGNGLKKFIIKPVVIKDETLGNSK